MKKLETAYICDAVRTPFGRYGGSLAALRADDLAALPIQALMMRNIVDWAALDDVFMVALIKRAKTTETLPEWLHC